MKYIYIYIYMYQRGAWEEKHRMVDSGFDLILWVDVGVSLVESQRRGVGKRDGGWWVSPKSQICRCGVGHLPWKGSSSICHGLVTYKVAKISLRNFQVE
jgi:hypothetical protein